jgi:hypothetical protein
LPPIEKLSLDDKEIDKQQLQQMGTILNLIDFIGMFFAFFSIFIQ